MNTTRSSTLSLILLILGVAVVCGAQPAGAQTGTPSVVTHAGDYVRPIGDPALPDHGSAGDVGQGAERAIDGDNAKYYNRSRYVPGYAGSGLLVVPSVGPTIVTGLSVTSGDDSPQRDPTGFTLYGSNDLGKTFAPIVTGQAIPPFAGRNQNQRVLFANTRAYAVYKIIFPTVAGTEDFQVDEADLIGVPVPAAAGAPYPPMALGYDAPGTDAENQGMPIGDGRIGALVLGGYPDDRMVFNEDSLWTGDENLSGNYDTMGSYEMFGEVRLHLTGDAIPSGYRRTLDLASALAHVDYHAGAVAYHRECFAGFPDQVIVERLTADTPGSYTGTLDLGDAHNGAVTADGSTLTSRGALPNGERYEAQLTVLHDGGTLSVSGNRLEFHGCNRLTLILGAGTDYVMDFARHYHGDDPHDRVTHQVAAAAVRPYDDLKTRHLSDYQPLFERVHLDLGKSPADRRLLPTDRRRQAAGDGNDPELEALQFQYGRYLTIACSRPGSLPSNLLGLWNDGRNVVCHSDYHTNINIQMNYWPTEETNLSECQMPLFDLIESQVPGWRAETALDTDYNKMLGGKPLRGFDIRTSHNITGGTGWKWNRGSNAWYCLHYWEHYAFTGDKAFLRDRAYPMMKEVAGYWEDHLKSEPDGTLVVPNAWSPEHGEFEDGISYAQEIVYDLFTHYVQAAHVLGVDADEAAKVAALRDKLYVPGIGQRGQLQEWMEDKDSPTEHHRHTSHLWGVYPGNQITLDKTPALAQAARVALVERGEDGDSNAEWAHVWRASLWARLHEPERAHPLLARFIAEGTSPNLFGYLYGAAQLDGDWGFPAAVTEALLQSQNGEIELLPALPKAWPTGYVSGLRARGGYVVDVSWANGALTKAVIRSTVGTETPVRYGATVVPVSLTPGKSVTLLVKQGVLQASGAAK